MTKVKYIHRTNVHLAYRRPGSNTIFIRDRDGRYQTFRKTADGKFVRLPARRLSLNFMYGRINYRNDTRFTGRTRSQSRLKQRFDMATHSLQSLWVDLPPERITDRRKTNQGMDNAMLVLTGSAVSATNYANWYKGRNVNPEVKTGKWEWCHLVAHSMGGADGPTNIVAAVKGNNSEQLIIESALSMYRRENIFAVQITAALISGGDGRHMGDVIKYEVRSTAGGANYVRYLDCLNAPNPSEFHAECIRQEFSIWANKELAKLGPVSASETKQLLQYCED